MVLAITGVVVSQRGPKVCNRLHRTQGLPCGSCKRTAKVIGPYTIMVGGRSYRRSRTIARAALAGAWMGPRFQILLHGRCHAEPNEMAKTPHQRNAPRQGQRLAAMARAKRILNLKRKGEKLLSDRVLSLLAAAKLPLQKQAYRQKLREILGG